MKRCLGWILLLFTVLLIIPDSSPAFGETGIDLREAEWTWDGNSAASFEGNITFENPDEKKVVLKLSLKTVPDSSDPGKVVFQVINGKKLTIRKQQPDIAVEGEGLENISFTGAWKTPGDVFFTGVEITLTVFNGDETAVIAEKKFTVSRNKTEADETDDGKFRLKTDFDSWTRWASAAAAVIWILAAARLLIHHRNMNRKR